jgi:[protein-PII] uridylyltransferase
VDRHLLEAVGECAAILDEDGFDGDVARGASAELLLLGALLHDIGKGRGGDHSTIGSETARAVAVRMGLDGAAVATLEWLVQHHLLLADTATRRDLGDEVTITRCAEAVGTAERLDLLYVLTIGDSRATGPAAWSTSKAALVRELYSKTRVFLEHGAVAMPVPFAPEVEAHHRQLVAAGTLAVEWADRPDGRLECTVAAPDRRGLLAIVAGALALHGFDVHDAAAFSHPEGMAIEVFGGHDRFGRLDDDGRMGLQRDLAAALAGDAALGERLADRARRYRHPGAARAAIGVTFDLAASETATVVEVHAPDEVGLLARVAATFASLGLDVSLALVNTLGERVVDVFYVRDASGAKLTDPLTLDRLKATLIARLTSDLLPL